MADMRLPQLLPEKYLPFPGEPSMKFRTWFRLLEEFFTMTNTTRPDDKQLTDRQKNGFLYSLLGAEGVRIFSAHPISERIDNATFQEFSNAAKELFDRPQHPVKAHFEFSSRVQHPSESVDDFYTALRTLMADCDFHGQENYHLALQLVNGCYRKDAQQKLLTQAVVNLDEFLRILRAEEVASSSASVLRGDKKLHNVQYGRPVSRQPNRRFSPKRQVQSSSFCLGCGNASHEYNSSNCPAKTVTCHFCQRRGHFQKYCLKKKSEKKDYKPVRMLQMSPVKTVSRFHENFLVYNGHFASEISFEIDTGADTSTIPYSVYKSKFSNIPLEFSNAKLTNYDGSPVENVKGCFETEISFDDRSCTGTFHVVPEPCNAVLGTNVLSGLKIQVNCATGKISAIKEETLTEISEKFPNLVSKEIGLFPDLEHKVKLSSEAKPVAQKLRPIPLDRKDKVISEINVMVDSGIWEPCDKSEWALNMVTMLKPSGEARITTDLSPLNKYVVPDRFPLPLIKEMFLNLKGAKFFSKLDLRRGYFHVSLHSDSRPLTATLTPIGVFQYTRLPMGLKDSASMFQKAVTLTLANVPGTIAYIDDILVYGSTREEHDNNLKIVLERLNAKNFRLNVEKCLFCSSKVTFLGHHIENGTVSPDPKKVQAVTDAPTPKNVAQVKSFLGLINYYCDFLPNLATLAEPLRKLLRKNVKFVWSNECQDSFNKLKQLAGKKLVVYVFDPDAKTVLTTDASDVGIGACLSQIQHDKEVPIFFASHTLNAAQRNYAINEKEAFAVLWFCEHFEKFLLGRNFVIRTDHAPLSTMLTGGKDKRQSSKFIRWKERLSVFDFNIQYCKGKDNKVADALSRLSLDEPTTVEEVEEKKSFMYQFHHNNISLEKLQTATESDLVLQQVKKFTQTRWPKSCKNKPQLQQYFLARNEISVESGCLMKGSKVIVPAELQSTVLKLAHTGHPGIVRTKRLLRQSYWWPGLDKQVESLVRSCIACQDSTKSRPKVKVPTAKIERPENPWEKLGIDIAGPFAVAPYHERFIVSVVDYFSNFPEILTTGSVTSTKIISWLDEIFARYGLPKVLVSDNGPQFVSDEFTNYLAKNNIKHHRTAVYNPQQNGMVEVFNRFLKHGIETFAAENVSWKIGLNRLLAHYRATSLSPEGGKSPSELLLGRKMRLIFQIPEIVHEKVKKKFMKSIHSFRGPYKLNDMVRTLKPQVLKGQCRWSTPLHVIQVLGNWTYKLSNGSIWNARKLRRYIPESNQLFECDVNPKNVETALRRSTRLKKVPERFSSGRK